MMPQHWTIVQPVVQADIPETESLESAVACALREDGEVLSIRFTGGVAEGVRAELWNFQAAYLSGAPLERWT